MILVNWYNFLIGIFFWIFLWNLYDLLVQKLKLDAREQLIYNIAGLAITIILITLSSSFFDCN